jgi:hypothetical protein
VAIDTFQRLCDFICPSHVSDREPVDIELLVAELHCLFDCEDDYDNDNDSDNDNDNDNDEGTLDSSANIRRPQASYSAAPLSCASSAPTCPDGSGKRTR